MPPPGQLRVFFSFHIPDAAGSRLLGDIGADAPLALYSHENLHITLFFVGAVTPEQLPALYEAATAAATAARGPLQFVPERFSVVQERLRLQIKASPELVSLNAALTAAIVKAGIAKLDSRPYAPHITLGRPAPTFDMQTLGRLRPADYAFALSNFGLYKSEPGQDRMGSYTLLRSFDLG